MDEDDDDMYAPSEPVLPEAPGEAAGEDDVPMQEDHAEEEEEDEDDSDIEIVTVRKPTEKAEPPAKPARIDALKGAITKAESPSPIFEHPQSPVVKTGPSSDSTAQQAPSKPGSAYPAIHSSTIDVNATPTYGPAGKPLNEVNLDADFGEDDKAWRRPGMDQTDFFNYGFDEFTWAQYSLKQTEMRQQVKDQKKSVEEMTSFLDSSGMPDFEQFMRTMMPGMAGMPGGGAPGFVSGMGAQMGMSDSNQGDSGGFRPPEGPSQDAGGYGGYGGYGGGGGGGGRGGRGRGRRW